MPASLRLALTATLAACLAAILGGAGGAARVPLCAAAALTPVYVDSTAGAGSIDGEYGFRNRSVHRCVLSGYPTVGLRTRPGAKLPTSERHAPGAYGISLGQVSLSPGSTAYFGLHYASQTGYGTRHCPTSGVLELTAPGTSTGLVLDGRGGQIAPYGGTIEQLRCGLLAVSALTGKRFQ